MQLFKGSGDLQYPVLSRVAIGIGLVGMGVSAFGSWRFGLSLTEDFIDRYWLAFLYVVGDVAAAVMVAVGGAMLAREGWKTKLGGVAAMIPALALVMISVLSTFGVMSGRIAVLSGQQQIVASDHSRMEQLWRRNQTVEPAIADARAAAAAECFSGRGPRCAAAEARAAALALKRKDIMAEERKAYQEARKASAVVTDNQAVAAVNLAALFGFKMSVQGAQVALTLASSTIPMSVKFICLGLGFLLYGYKRNPQDANRVSTVSGSPEGGGGSRLEGSNSPEPSKGNAETVAARSATVTPLRKADRPVVQISPDKPRLSLSEYLKQHPGVTYTSQAALAKATGFSPATVSRELKQLEGRRKVKRSKRKRGANSVTYGGHGGLQAAV
jgi:hypothetical protein